MKKQKNQSKTFEWMIKTPGWKKYLAEVVLSPVQPLKVDWKHMLETAQDYDDEDESENTDTDVKDDSVPSSL